MFKFKFKCMLASAQSNPYDMLILIIMTMAMILHAACIPHLNHTSNSVYELEVEDFAISLKLSSTSNISRVTTIAFNTKHATCSSCETFSREKVVSKLERCFASVLFGPRILWVVFVHLDLWINHDLIFVKSHYCEHILLGRADNIIGCAETLLIQVSCSEQWGIFGPKTLPKWT